MLGTALPMLIACLAPTASRPASQPTALQATVDPRVELMSIIFRLAGNPEYNLDRSRSPYATEVEKYFGKFKDHPVVQLARKLRQTRGVSYDAVMRMAVHLTDTQSLKERVPFDRLHDADPRWRRGDAQDFVAKARQFVADTKFNDFFKAHATLYGAAADRMTPQTNKHGCIEWFNAFFGPRPGVGFRVVFAMLIGGDGYGPSVQLADGREEIYSILGTSKFDDQGIPIIPDVSGGLVHEFCHSYTNRIVDKYLDQLKPAGKKLFAHRQEVMKQQAYGTWQTLMYESTVRACEVRYALDTQGKAAANNTAVYNQQRGFSWTGELAKCLQEYEDHRDRYPTLDLFMPKVVEFFNDYVPRFEAQIAKSPKVVSMTPANGVTNVDPDLTEIKITFDRPMRDKSWAVVGGGPQYPDKAGDIHYDKECKVLTIPVRLKPNWEYRFWLNKGQYNSFASREGVPLESVAVTFKTRPQ